MLLFGHFFKEFCSILSALTPYWHFFIIFFKVSYFIPLVRQQGIYMSDCHLTCIQAPKKPSTYLEYGTNQMCLQDFVFHRLPASAPSAFIPASLAAEEFIHFLLCGSCLSSISWLLQDLDSLCQHFQRSLEELSESTHISDSVHDSPILCSTTRWNQDFWSPFLSLPCIQ